jgi:hypothetical protein
MVRDYTGFVPLATDRRAAAGSVLTAIVAVVLAVAAMSPALDVGFLSDDFYFVRRIAGIAESNSGLFGQLREGVRVFGRWHEDYSAFRPLTIATLQLDYAVHGLDAIGFRATNLALWIVASWLFSAVCAAYVGITSRGGRAATFLLLAWWPLAIEPMAWTVIRQDSLLVGAALAGALILGRKRGQPWLVTAPLIVGLMSKETAMVLPVLFAAVDAALLRREGVSPRGIAGALARRGWPWFVAAGAWWAIRRVAGGGMVWAGQSHADVLLSEGGPMRLVRGLLSGLRALVLPVNLDRAGGLVPIALAGLVGAAALVAVVVALRRARAADVAAGAIWLVVPMVPALTFYVVGPALDSIRSMLLPGLAFLFAVAAGAARIAGLRPRLVLAASLVFLAAQALVLRFNLGPFVDTSELVERISAEVGRWPAGTAHVLRARHPGGGLAPTLLVHRGVFLFSSIHDTLGPPFVPSGVRLVLLGQEDEPGLADLVGDEGRRGVIASLVHDRDEPRFQVLAGGALGAPVELSPSHGETVGRERSPVLSVTFPAGVVAAGDACILTVADPAGNLVEARRVISTPDLGAGPTRIEFTAREFGLPESSAPLVAVPAPLIIWSATLIRGGTPVARSAYAVVTLAAGG